MVQTNAKRGRPKASDLPELIREGELDDGPYKCEYCFRNFPRMKSLFAHRRIHTDEKPYFCTYPSCSKTFRQSGQLKTHVRRHTGEKPFACPSLGCTKRFIHSCRQCPRHPKLELKRDFKEDIYIPENLSEEEFQWFEEYKENKGRPSKRKISTHVSQYVNLPNNVPQYAKKLKYETGEVKVIENNESSSPSSGFTFSSSYYGGSSSSDPSSDSSCSGSLDSKYTNYETKSVKQIEQNEKISYASGLSSLISSYRGSSQSSDSSCSALDTNAKKQICARPELKIKFPKHERASTSGFISSGSSYGRSSPSSDSSSSSASNCFPRNRPEAAQNNANDSVLTKIEAASILLSFSGLNTNNQLPT